LRYRVIAFDLDGTLLRGTTVSLRLAEWTGTAEALSDLETRFAAGEISNSVVADMSATWLAGRALTDVARLLEDGPWIDGIAETVDALHVDGAEVLLATITWRFAAECLAERFGFDAVSGTEMEARDGIVTGTVTRQFDEWDKLAFVEGFCRERGVPLAEAAAVGDSRSDIPLFGRVGMSIALNATPEARKAASVALDTGDLRDVLPLLGAGEDESSGSAH
jgi:phosphoserine phosphatase